MRLKAVLLYYLDHATAGDGTRPGRRSGHLHLGVVRLVLAVGPAVKQPQGGAVVVQGANVADECCGVHHWGLPLPQSVVPALHMFYVERLFGKP